MLREFIEYLSGLYLKKEISPAVAYDLWASTYDDQPGNLIMDIDQEVFNSFLNTINLSGKTVVDVGCGTGRHWKKILDQKPRQLIGYDVSVRMLKRLTTQFPEAVTHLLTGYNLYGLNSDSCDFLVSTLTISHIENLEKTFEEWNRVLKPGAGLIVTDYHPELLAKGEKRIFKYKNKTIAIRSYIHSIEKIKLLAQKLHWQEINFIERKIDETVQEYYKNLYAVTVYEKFKGTPVFYGIQLRKSL